MKLVCCKNVAQIVRWLYQLQGSNSTVFSAFDFA